MTVLNVTAAGAYEHVLHALAPLSERETGAEIKLAIANAAGVIKRIETKEPADVVLTSAAGIARLVAAGLADRVEIQLAYAIGVADPVSVSVDTFDTGKIEQDKISELVRENFQLTPRGIIESLELRRPIYRKTASYGHFGRNEPEFSWEKTDKAAKLKEQAGI